MNIVLRPDDLLPKAKELPFEEIAAHHFQLHVRDAIYNSNLALYIAWDGLIGKVIYASKSHHLGVYYDLADRSIVTTLMRLGQEGWLHERHQIKPPFDPMKAGWAIGADDEEGGPDEVSVL